MQAFEVWYLTSKDVASTEQHQSLSSEYIDYTYTFLRLHKFQTTPASFKGNTDTSGLVSGLVPIRSGDCGAKFKPGYLLVCIKNCIRILSLSFQDLEDFQSG